MFENQAIFLVLGIFLILYLGIFLRYYLISKSSYSISKFFLVKFFIRSFLLFTLILAIYLIENPSKSNQINRADYIVLSSNWISKSKQELTSEIIEKLNKFDSQSLIGCLVKKDQRYFILIPKVKRKVFEKYINQFNLKNLPTFELDKNFRLRNEFVENKGEESTLLQSIFTNFNIYNISILRNYLLILIVAIFALESLFIKKIIKN